MPYQISNKLNWFPGMAFGHNQPTCIINVEIPSESLLTLSEKSQQVASLLNDNAFLKATQSAIPFEQAVAYISHLFILVQRAVDIPVFKPHCSCLIKHQFIEGGRHSFMLALPCLYPKFAFRIMKWVADSLFDSLRSIEELRSDLHSLHLKLRRLGVKGTNAIHLLESANISEIYTRHLFNRTYVFGHGSASIWLDSTVTDKSSLLGNSIAKDKHHCAIVLRAYGLPVPFHQLAFSEEQASQIANQIGYPVVVKPANLDQGAGVSAGLLNDTAVKKAYADALKLSNRILVEKHIDGADFRITVLHGKVIKIMQRFAGGVTGDGRSTLVELLAQVQASTQSQKAFKREGKFRLLLDEEAKSILNQMGLEEDSVIPHNQFIPLRRKNNISTGGSQKLIPLYQAHPDNLSLACRASEVLGLDISGVDLLIPDISKSWLISGGAICEVNGQPQIGKSETPEIFSQILSTLMPDAGIIPLFLQITIGLDAEQSFEISLEAARNHGCNGFSVCNQVVFNEKVDGQPALNGFDAARRLLIDRRIHAAIISMTAEEVLLYGLPTFQWINVRIFSSSISSQNVLLNNVLNFLGAFNFDIEQMIF